MKHIARIVALLCFAVSLYAQLPATGLITAASTDCSTANSCVTLNLPVNAGTAVIQVSSAFIQYLAFEATADGTTWGLVSASPQGGTSALARIPTTGAATGGFWRVNVAGFVGLRVRGSTFFSGGAQVQITSAQTAYAPAP